MSEISETPQVLRHAAIDLLSRREHSRVELRRKLQRRFGDVPSLENVLDELSNQGWASDRRFTENYLRYRASKGLGPVRIRQELRERGISEELMAEFINHNDSAWEEQLREAWMKRFKGAYPQNQAEKAQQYRFLQQRGFPLEQISKLLNEKME